MKFKNEQELIDYAHKQKPKNTRELGNIIFNEKMKIPYLKKNINEMILLKGQIIHTSILLEEQFDSLIDFTNHPERIKSDFRKKAGYVKQLCKKLDKEFKILDNHIIKKLDRFVEIRNLFAHVPLDDFSEELFFKETPTYLKYVGKIQKKSVKELKKEFDLLFNSLIPEMDKLLNLIFESLLKGNKEIIIP